MGDDLNGFWGIKLRPLWSEQGDAMVDFSVNVTECFLS